MGLFVCDRCNHIENTATSNYWFVADDAEKLCSECDPESRFGGWHDLFARTEYRPDYHQVKNR